MYQQIINEINRFLNHINLPGSPINPNAFQGVFVKKLSNQNIIKEKRRINAGDTVSNVNQTHLDITGRQGMLFFFEELNDSSSAFQSIDIDLFENNLCYLQAIDIPVSYVDTNGTTFFTRRFLESSGHLSDLGNMLHSSAYKKYGHTGDQVQINIPDSDEAFTILQKCAFQDDALIMLRYDYLRYFAVLIPGELCDTLYSITNTHGNQNVNLAILNPNYNPSLAHHLQYDIVSTDVMHEEVDIQILSSQLRYNPNAGTEIERLAKGRMAQGAFRRLLLLERHQCNLCSISTTSVLRASHIKEWSDSSREERIDPDNGLLLCANHDALFDRHQISFQPDTGDICISTSLSNAQREALNLPDKFSLDMTERMKSYMRIHYQKFTNKENI